jgi:hypothetical protein
MVAELERGHMDVSQLYTLRAIYRLVRAFAWFVLLMLPATIAGGIVGALRRALLREIRVISDVFAVSSS